uniref:Uncharacterized protein n=1 Tax=Romanomermis culicivorax TaxID=13658 RepID=A0A915J2J9_ROMCU
MTDSHKIAIVRKKTCSFGVHDAFGNAFAVEMGHFVQIDHILQEQGTAWTDKGHIQVSGITPSARHRQPDYDEAGLKHQENFSLDGGEHRSPIYG